MYVVLAVHGVLKFSGQTALMVIICVGARIFVRVALFEGNKIVGGRVPAHTVEVAGVEVKRVLKVPLRKAVLSCSPSTVEIKPKIFIRC